MKCRTEEDELAELEKCLPPLENPGCAAPFPKVLESEWRSITIEPLPPPFPAPSLAIVPFYDYDTPPVKDEECSLPCCILSVARPVSSSEPADVWRIHPSAVSTESMESTKKPIPYHSSSQKKWTDVQSAPYLCAQGKLRPESGEFAPFGPSRLPPKLSSFDMAVGAATLLQGDGRERSASPSISLASEDDFTTAGVKKEPSDEESTLDPIIERARIKRSIKKELRANVRQGPESIQEEALRVLRERIRWCKQHKVSRPYRPEEKKVRIAWWKIKRRRAAACTRLRYSVRQEFAQRRPRHHGRFLPMDPKPSSVSS